MHLLLWLPILFSGCLIFLGWRANIIYLPVLLKEAGGTSAHQGAAMAIMNISSFPVLLTFPQLTKHYSLSKLMAIGGTFMALRILFVPFLKSAQLLTMVQVLEGVSYGLLQPAIMELFARHAADSCPRPYRCPVDRNTDGIEYNYYESNRKWFQFVFRAESHLCYICSNYNNRYDSASGVLRKNNQIMEEKQ